ncbi:MAG: zf-TFIIB domain-containing protein, partial [Chloroflexota bacterium]|nr:zf-TFIIB domain-containing protein [Chloroflexota bacterium]
MSTTMEMLCPKCQASMRVMERNGVTVERCTECGGIFLDRGELERLSRAEGEYNERTYTGYRRDDDDDDDDDHKRGYSERDTRDGVPHQGRPHKKK